MINDKNNATGFSPKAKQTLDFARRYNIYASSTGRPLVNIRNTEEALASIDTRIKQAALDGVDTAGGLDLLQTKYEDGIKLTGSFGNVFLSAGMDLETNFQGRQFTYDELDYGDGSGYVERTGGAYTHAFAKAPTQNDVTGVMRHHIGTMKDYVAEMAIDKIVKQGKLNDPLQLERAFQFALEAKQTLLHDELVLDKLIAEGVGIAPSTDIGASIYNLHMYLIENNQPGAAIFMNTNAFSQFLQLVGTDGHFKYSNLESKIELDGQRIQDVNGVNREYGYVATFAGRKIYVVKTPKNGVAGFTRTMAFDGTHAFTGYTGSDKSIILAVDPEQIKMKSGMENMMTFKHDSSLALFQRGVDVVAREVTLGVAIASQDACVYTYTAA